MSMIDSLQGNGIGLILIVLLVLMLLAWLLLRSRRTRVELTRHDDEARARRNQALIDAPPAAPPADLPPPAPMGLAGVGEIVQAAAEPVPAAPAATPPTVASGDDLTRIKGLGPKIADQLATLVAEPITFTGAAVAQVQAVVRRVDEVVARHPGAAAYTPGAIL